MPPSPRLIIAIDGPAGAGKSTAARRVAGELGYRYLDTGAMYRAIALAALQRGAELSDDEALSRIAQEVEIDLRLDADVTRVWLNGKEVTRAIRAPEVTDAASRVSRVPGVRQTMVRLQRSWGEGGGVVMEGRDIGTVVFPHADLKIYLDASSAERARRRAAELNAQGRAVDPETVRQELATRDARDIGREASPLVRAPDAILVETDGLTADAVVQKILAICRAQGGGPVTYWIMRALFTLFFRVLGSWEVRGHEHVPREGPVLIAPNHLSYLDPPLIGCALRRPGWFMAKAELFKIPGFAWLIRGMHAYPVRRGTVDRAALKRTFDYLKNGEIVCVFPEGTRSLDGELGPIEIGIGMLALKSGAPIVPVGIRGTDRMLPRDARRIRRAKIRVQFGPPLAVPAAPHGWAERAACQHVADQVRDALQALLGEMDAPLAVPSPGEAP